MLKRILILTLAMGTVYGRVGYTVKSPYLQNPSLNIEYIRKQADFYIQAKDMVNGGFYTWLNRWGGNSNNLKGFVGASLLGYAFSKAFMVTGDESYLEHARHALQFLFDHGWDSVYGGWYFFSDTRGVIPANDPFGSGFNTYRSYYVQNFSMIGIAAIYEATGESFDWLMAGENWLDEHMWDGRVGFEGYYSKTKLDGTSPSGKGWGPTVDCIPTHSISSYLMTREDRFKTRLARLGDEIIIRLVDSMNNPDVKFGFPMVYDSDWIRGSDTGCEVGAVLKTALSLALIDMIQPDLRYGKAARRLILDIWSEGYDHTYGGPFGSIRWNSGEINEESKDYWTLDQAVYCGLANYYAASDGDSLKDICLQMADESLDFFMNHFVDPVYGGTYWAVTRSGAGAAAGGGDVKGDGGKAGYQEIELAYNAYLYGNLILQNQPVSLYYFFKPKDQSQAFSLYPLALKDDSLKIAHVTLDGEPFSNYDPDTRTLNLAAGVGGKFFVTFKYNNGTSNAVEAQKDVSPSGFEIFQNYPNPFNPVTTIAFSMPRHCHVTLKVYDTLGKEVAVLVSQTLEKGSHTYTFDGSGLENGLYIYQLEAENYKQAKKFMLIK
jgi:mannose/cellobiose epimerase-like protein (N-acyl-D-glucosamine 2-epimerase family)